jgi:hypothetical protein
MSSVAFSLGSRAAALAVAGLFAGIVFGLSPAGAQQMQMREAGATGSCRAMSAQQRSVALKLLDSITDEYDVSATYLQGVVDCIKGVSAARPIPVSKADRDAHGRLVVLLTAKGIPAP